MPLPNALNVDGARKGDARIQKRVQERFAAKPTVLKQRAV